MAGLLVLPLAAVSWAAATGVTFRGHAAVRNPTLGRVVLTREASFYARPLLLIIGFSAVTLPWLAVLIKALQGKFAPLRGFLGNVDLTAYLLPMPRLRMTDCVLLVAAVLPPLLLVPRDSKSVWKRRGTTVGLCICVGLLAVYVIESVSVRCLQFVLFSFLGGGGPFRGPLSGPPPQNCLPFFLPPNLAFPCRVFYKLLHALYRKKTTHRHGRAPPLLSHTPIPALPLKKYPPTRRTIVVRLGSSCCWPRISSPPVLVFSSTNSPPSVGPPDRSWG